MREEKPLRFGMERWLRDHYRIPDEYRRRPGWRKVKFVVLALLTRWNPRTGTSYPSMVTFCKNWNMTRHTAFGAIALAEELGLLRIARRKGKVNVYSFPLLEQGARNMTRAGNDTGAGFSTGTRAGISTGVVAESAPEQKKKRKREKEQERGRTPEQSPRGAVGKVSSRSLLTSAPLVGPNTAGRRPTRFDNTASSSGGIESDNRTHLVGKLLAEGASPGKLLRVMTDERVPSSDAGRSLDELEREWRRELGLPPEKEGPGMEQP